MNNAEITSDQIGFALRRISLDEYIDANEARRHGQQDLQDLDPHTARLSFFKNPTDNVLISRERSAKTTRTLKGSVRLLRAHTLVHHETFQVPEIITKESVENLIYRRELAKVAFERIQVIEPSLIMQKQFRYTGYFTRSDETETQAEVDGLTRILNEPEAAFLDSEQIDEQLTEIASLYLQIRREEGDYVTSVLKSIVDGTSNS